MCFHAFTKKLHSSLAVGRRIVSAHQAMAHDGKVPSQDAFPPKISVYGAIAWTCLMT